MKMRRHYLLAGLLAFALAGGAGWAGSAPALVNYQGVLRDSQGKDFAPGTYRAEFRLWSAPDGGTALWGKAYDINVIAGGEFSVVLGDGGTNVSPAIQTALDVAVLGTDRSYLSIVIVKTPAGPVAAPHELAPRQQWVSSAYALSAGVADSTQAVGGHSDFFDLSHLDKSRVPAGGMRMLGMSNSTLVYLPATLTSGGLMLETNLTVGASYAPTGYDVAIKGVLKTDVLRGPPGGKLALTNNVKLFASSWTQVALGSVNNTGNGDAWVMIQLPDMSLLPAGPVNSIGIRVNGIAIDLLQCQGPVQSCERCLTYPLPANTSWSVFSGVDYPTNAPIVVRYLALKGS